MQGRQGVEKLHYEQALFKLHTGGGPVCRVTQAVDDGFSPTVSQVIRGGLRLDFAVGLSQSGALSG